MMEPKSNRQYIYKSSSGINVLPADSYDLCEKGIIRIEEEITSEYANRIRDDIIYLQGRNMPIRILINSPGGSVIDGLVIVDLIEGATVPVDAYVTGMAASMAALILAAAPKGHRHILPSSQVLIHEPRVMQGMGGTASEMNARARSLMDVRDITTNVLSRHTGHDAKVINRIIRDGDRVFSAEEAVAWGIADDITRTLIFD